MKNNILYKTLSFLWRTLVLKPYRAHKIAKHEKFWSERYVSYGRENSDKEFYVIRRRDTYCGLCSIMLTTLARIDKTMKNGQIPIVDMQTSFNLYLDKQEVGKINSWEYFFEQPYGYSLKDIKKSKNVIIGSGAVPKMFPYLDVDFLYGKTGELEHWRKLAHKNFRLKADIKEIIDNEYSRMFDTNDKVLGVKLRGTDYAMAKPKNHPIQPTIDEALSKVKEIICEQKCNKIFLATEDASIYSAFKDEFGDKLETNKTDYHKYNGGSIGQEEYNERTSAKDLGIEYLVTTMILSKCNCLCAGCVSGTVAALLMTEGYEYTYLFDLGIYQ